MQITYPEQKTFFIITSEPQSCGEIDTDQCFESNREGLEFYTDEQQYTNRLADLDIAESGE